MRPVDEKWPVSQHFAEGATAGIAPNADPGSGMSYYVYLYGDYQHDGHAGTDIACPVATPVKAMRAGTVVWAGWDVDLPGGPNDWGERWFFYQRFGGRITLIQHGPSDFTAYAHQSKILVAVGEQVAEGEVIGLSGDSSAGKDGAIAPHLHTEHLVDLTYSTGGGLIYGRTSPEPLFGGTISPAGTITPLEDEVTPEQMKTLTDKLDNLAGILLYGYKSGDKQHPGIAMVAEENQRRIAALPGLIWGWLVNRGDKKVPAIQELADIKSKVLDLAPVIAQIQTATADDVTATIPDDLAQQVIDNLAARLAGKDA